MESSERLWLVVDAGDRIEDIQEIEAMSIEVVLDEMVLSMLSSETNRDSSDERLRSRSPSDRDIVLNEVAAIAEITLRG
jgi:hypothetical protein